MYTDIDFGSKTRQEKPKNTEAIFTELKYPGDCNLMAVTGQRAYLVRISIVSKNNNTDPIHASYIQAPGQT